MTRHTDDYLTPRSTSLSKVELMKVMKAGAYSLDLIVYRSQGWARKNQEDGLSTFTRP
jgi:hypothetical protein